MSAPSPAVPLIDAKVQVPTLPARYRARDRVSRSLDGPPGSEPSLILVSAPPGYGKTLAVAGWLGDRATRTAWLTLEPADDDLARFARYVAAALEAIRPGASVAVEPLLEPSLAATPGSIGATLLATIGTSDDPFALVLDDYHVIRSARVHELVRGVIDHCPPFATIVLVTRRDPPFRMGRLRAAGRMLEVRLEDLRFTHEEARGFLEKESRLTLIDADVVSLIDRSEGWIAALQLAAISLGRSDGSGRLIDDLNRTREYVFDYLGDEVMDSIGPVLAAFLVRTSIVDRFTPELARRLSGRDDTQALLDEAARSNLFLIQLDPVRHWFRYHQLFSDYLRSRVPEEEAQALHAVAAAYLEECGETQDALEHALSSGDGERALRIVASTARDRFEAGELSSLTSCLARLPQERVASDADVASFGAWALFLQGDLNGAGALAEAAAPDPVSEPSATGRLYAVRAVVRSFAGDPGAYDLARRGLALLRADPFFEGMAGLVAGEAELSQGHPVAAAETLSGALERVRAGGLSAAAARIVYVLVLAMLHEGRRRSAEQVAADVLSELSATSSISSLLAGLPRIAIGMTRYEANDLDGARGDLEAGFRDAWTMGFGRVLVGQDLEALALTCAATGDLARGVEVASRAAQDARRHGASAWLVHLDALRAELDLQGGRLDAALAWAESQRQPAPPLIPPVEFGRSLRLARVHIAAGRLADAEPCLQRARAIASAAASVPFSVSVATHEALVHALADRQPAAVRSLGEAISLAAPDGYARRILEGGGAIARLLPFVRRIDSAFVDRLISQAPADPARSVSAWSPPAGTTRTASREALVEPLTPRERDVLRRMARGESNVQIADALAVSPGTAKWHVGHVLAKLGAQNRTEAIVRGQRLGLIGTA